MKVGSESSALRFGCRNGVVPLTLRALGDPQERRDAEAAPDDDQRQPGQ